MTEVPWLEFVGPWKPLLEERNNRADPCCDLLVLLDVLAVWLVCVFPLGWEDSSDTSCEPTLFVADWRQLNCLEVLQGVPSESTSLELDSVDDDDDKGPDEEFEECLLSVSEVLFLGFPSASVSSARLLLHLSSC